MRRTAADKLRELAFKQEGPERKELTGLDGLLELILGGPPLPTQKEFIFDSVPEQQGRLVRVKGYRGPLGCAKTATLCAMGLMRSLLIPGSRLLVARLTYGELETTTQARMLEQVYRLPPGVIFDYNRTPPAKLTLAPVVDGALKPSEILFHSLDDPQKLASVEFTDAIIDEASEISSDTVHKVETRCGRQHCGQDVFFIGLAFNPPSTAHWLYKESEGAPESPYIKLFRPQPRENALNLPAGYYESLSRTLPPDQRRRLIEGEWGADYGGMPVYPDFREALHVNSYLQYQSREPIYRFWDFGFNNPCCLIVQRGHMGHLKVLHEIDGSREEIEPFVKRVRSEASRLGFPEPNPENDGGADYGDPAAYQHKDTGQTSARLAKMGVILLARPSKIEDGLGVVRNLMTQVADGRPMLQIHPRCRRLIEALSGGYRYRETKENQIPKLIPHKDDYFDHACDALRYGCLNLNLGLLSREDWNSALKQTSVLADPYEDEDSWLN